MPPTTTISEASLEHEESMNGEGFDFEPSEESGSVRSGKGAIEEKDVIAHGETKAVGRLKFVVTLVLVASAIAVAFSVNSFIRDNEQELFEEEFRDDGAKVLESIGLTFEKTLRTFDNVAVTFVTVAAATNQTWPFVTIPNFPRLMTTVLELSNAIHVDFIPVAAPELRSQWEEYSSNNENWINEAMAIQELYSGYNGPIVYNGTYEKRIHDDDGTILTINSRPIFPIWQNFPVVPNETYTYNFDFATLLDPEERTALIEKHEAIVSKPCMIPLPGDVVGEEEAADLAEEAKHYISKDEEPREPMSDVIYPILDKRSRTTALASGSKNASEDVLVGLISTAIYWRSMIKNILPVGSNGVHVVIHNSCSQPFTYEINGPNVLFLGVRDQHETKYDHLVQEKRLIDLETESVEVDEDFDHAQLEDNHCVTIVKVYPSDTTRDTYTTNNALIFTVAVAGIFLFTILVFYAYDMMVERRQKTVLESATRSSAIVSSLFPSAVRDRLYPQESKPITKRNKLDAFIPATAKGKLQSFLGDGKAHDEASSGMARGNPLGIIAELYTDTTVLFADIAGFTAWSSVRQPVQVFHLLESVYSAFDEIARRRGVFKVETVGDSYVAVVGLPAPRKQHAVVMAIFAHECRIKMNTLTRELEKSLGPGTADLAMRFGLNSGPTTAGVLRGDKSRFQLFGDTVNTAARMESNGERNRIQVSQKTADLIKASGRSHWLEPRVDEVHCKGKGLMRTYWCEPKNGSGSMASSEAAALEKGFELPSSEPESREVNQKRLVDWNVALFTTLLEEIATRRPVTKTKNQMRAGTVSAHGPPLHEVTDVLALPKLGKTKKQTEGKGQISVLAAEQLHELVASVAAMYPDRPFHNFDHCTHVVMSTKKLLDRIADCELKAEEECQGEDRSSKVIASSPLTHFAILFAALVHDVDHPGVSNAQLIKENHATAIAYAGKSVAEQNSVDTAWNLIMQPQFAELCKHIYTTEKEQKQFRQILVNVVMATDLFDQDLRAMREARWHKSFDDTRSTTSDRHLEDNDANRRATIIIELIIQASDVSHTMQHFTVYQKWNMCLLTEMYNAFITGRTDKNPLEGWYDGELWFFDNYIIPLAQKLRECGVFGVSCDEFLDYAKDNRMEWESKGREIVREAAEALGSRQAQVAPASSLLEM